ncbi:hypothetical protein MPL1032_20552 [Mesorhizobium plurifarium]|uniref:Uncharacterized protein n=1 Tax=Mesorhizobium plurifarium TaxID=69974 RepID=A0A0K2VXY9_MESPL|nr:hypothetical protein MPL1032_20552 [Mesorhizobium plurifarium]
MQMRAIASLAATFVELSTTTSVIPGECISHAFVKASITQGTLKATVMHTRDTPASCNSFARRRPDARPRYSKAL